MLYNDNVPLQLRHYEGTNYANTHIHIMDEYSDYAEVWLWLENERNQRLIKMLCERAAARYGNNVTADDMFDLAIDALIKYGCDWFNRWDSSTASISTYILSCIEFQLRRFDVCRNDNTSRRKIPRTIVCDDLVFQNVLYVDSEKAREKGIDSVVSVLEKLTKYERMLILWRHAYNLNFTDIAESLGVAKGTIRNHYLLAIQKARTIANE